MRGHELRTDGFYALVAGCDAASALARFVAESPDSTEAAGDGPRA